MQGSDNAGPAAPAIDGSERTYATRPQRRQTAALAKLSSPSGASHPPRSWPPASAASSALWQRSSSATVMLGTVPDGVLPEARPA